MANNNIGLAQEWLNLLADDNLQDDALAREAVVVYSTGLERVIWANVSAADLFGGTSLSAFLSAEIDTAHPFLRQLKSAVQQLGDERIYRGFRIVDAGCSHLLQCEIGLIELPDNGQSGIESKAVLLTCQNTAMSGQKEHEIASILVDGLADFGSATAICDEYGLIIAATDKFAESGKLADAMEIACSEFDGNSKLSHQVKMENNDNVVMNLYSLSNDHKRILVVVKDDDQARSEDILSTNIGAEAGGDEIVAGEAAASSSIFGRRTMEDNALKQQAFERKGSSDSSELQELEQGKIAAHSRLDENTVKTKAQGHSREASTDTKAQEEFVFSGESDPVRFAWTTDTQQVFTSVTPELAEAVGPNAADVVGRKWSDIATVFGFDSNGEIDSLLAKQDTWSGKSVLWPVQGTDLQVPVDLAALPSFSSGRNFDGFRGFGIVRILDAIVDPDESGLALVSGDNTPPVSENDQIDNVQIDWDQSVQHSTMEADGQNNPSNIVALKLPGDAHEDERDDVENDNQELSNGENQAFHEIGNNLRGAFPLHQQDGEPGMQSDEPVDEDLGEEPIHDRRDSLVDTSILEKLPVPVIVYRGEETLFANRELLDLTGYEEFSELHDAGGINALFDRDDTADFSEEDETVLSDKDGGQMRVKALLQSVPWDTERALLLSFRQPKHDKLPANEKIVLDMMRVSELQYILDTATDGIIILDSEGIIQSINQSAEALFGRADEDVSDKPVNELFAIESHDIINEYISNLDNPSTENLLNDGREVVGVEAKGGLIPLYITLGKIGTSDKYCAVLRDMTPWKKTQAELIDAKKLAEDASEQKTEFLARVSHEIRTPLNAIIGFSDVMIEERFGAVDNERYREYLRDINRSGVHVLDLINDLLDISKIEAGKMELTFEAVDLNKIVGETVALLQPQANGNRVIIRTSLSRAVPKVVADARSIRQIVLNLVSNAIKFTDANGQVIVSSVYEGNGEVALRVRDTGRGMSDEEVVIALKPFRQINSVSEVHGHGTGLGLPLTKALVEANKAYLDIESEPGEGTIVHIQFPSQRVLAD